MVGLDVGHHRDVGPVLHQRPVALVGLGDEVGAAAVVARWCRPRRAPHRRRRTGRIRSAAAPRSASTWWWSCRRCRSPSAMVSPAIRLASTTGRRITGMPRRRSLDQFGVGLGDGGVGGDHRGGRRRRACPAPTRRARSGSPRRGHAAPARAADSLASNPETLTAAVQQDPGDTATSRRHRFRPCAPRAGLTSCGSGPQPPPLHRTAFRRCGPTAATLKSPPRPPGRAASRCPASVAAAVIARNRYGIGEQTGTTVSATLLRGDSSASCDDQAAAGSTTGVR